MLQRNWTCSIIFCRYEIKTIFTSTIVQIFIFPKRKIIPVGEMKILFEIKLPVDVFDFKRRNIVYIHKN